MADLPKEIVFLNIFLRKTHMAALFLSALLHMAALFLKKAIPCVFTRAAIPRGQRQNNTKCQKCQSLVSVKKQYPTTLMLAKTQSLGNSIKLS